MAINEFLTFASGAGANVLSQAEYEALGARLTGFQAGVARSVEVNKAIRQAAFMASILAGFIADTTGQDVLDNGNAPAMLAALQAAILGGTPGRLIKTTVIKNAGSAIYVPTPGMRFVDVEIVGAGGGTGGLPATSSAQTATAGGGGSGAYARGIFTAAQIGSSVPLTIGAGGAAGAVGTGAGGAGGSTAFGSFMTAPGGGGSGVGIVVAANAVDIAIGGAAASIATGGTIANFTGVQGNFGFAILSKTLGGPGASTPLGTGGLAGGASFTPTSGSGMGAGAGGPSSGVLTAEKGGVAGLNGGIIIREYA